MASVGNTRTFKYPSTSFVRKLSIAAAALSAAAVAAEAAAVVAQQLGKSDREKSGLEGAVRMTIALTLAKAMPTLLKEIRTISEQMAKKP